MFPEDFLWGSANAAYQVEGDIEKNNWVKWEKKHAEQKSKKYPKELKNTRYWPYVKEDATNPDSYITGDAVDHYNRYEEDFDIAKELNHNAHRLSIAWERIYPDERGDINEEGIQHYHNVLDALHKRDIEPIVTLWHFSHPEWFENEGGWLSGDISAFYEYVETVVDEFGEKVDYWVTLNEPQVFAGHAYGIGAFPPGNKNPLKYWRAENRLLGANNTAYEIIKSKRPSANVGLTVNLSVFDGPDNAISRFLQKGGEYIYNKRKLDRTIDYMDFVGLNCYFYRWLWPTSPSLDGIDKELYPKPTTVVESVLRWVWDEYQKPIIITENGIRDSRDEYRWEYTKSVLEGVHDALQDGVDVRGYMHWSLLDNYCWQEGRWPRMGLVGVDPETKERTIRDSAYKIGEVYRTNKI